ncbi:MAG: hypothetical protein P9M14_14545 [Candidatus Alcyoniella australis]|nr:hypothetical protein [Candidatus Alcyoniella australis]
MEQQLSQLLEEVIGDRVSGAAQVTRKAAGLISQWIEQTSKPEPENFLELGMMLIQGQPSMAPVINLVNDVLLAMHQAQENGLKAKQGLFEFIHGFTERQSSTLESTIAAALPLVKPGDRIATHSYSSTVRDILLGAKRAGVAFQAIITEGRPNLESRTLAHELSSGGIKVEFVTDMGLFPLMDSIDKVFLGADAVTSSTLVNKAGTCAIAARCRQLGMPCYAFVTQEKFLAPQLEPLFKIVEHSPTEVWGGAPDGVTVRNIYFGRTQLDALSGLACEQGLLRPAQVEALIAKRPVSGLLTG